MHMAIWPWRWQWRQEDCEVPKYTLLQRCPIPFAIPPSLESKEQGTIRNIVQSLRPECICNNILQDISVQNFFVVKSSGVLIRILSLSCVLYHFCVHNVLSCLLSIDLSAGQILPWFAFKCLELFWTCNRSVNEHDAMVIKLLLVWPNAILTTFFLYF